MSSGTKNFIWSGTQSGIRKSIQISVKSNKIDGDIDVFKERLKIPRSPRLFELTQSLVTQGHKGHSKYGKHSGNV